MTLLIMTLLIMTLDLMTLLIMTLVLMTLVIITLLIIKHNSVSSPLSNLHVFLKSVISKISNKQSHT
jgi:hypothetical protein